LHYREPSRQQVEPQSKPIVEEPPNFPEKITQSALEQPTVGPSRGIEKYIFQDSESSEGSSSEDDNSDSEALMRELEKIKKEKAEAEAQRIAIKEEEAMNSNPLLSGGSKNALKRQWYQDTVFSNTRAGSQPSKKHINDSIRGEDHKKFLRKYIG